MEKGKTADLEDIQRALELPPIRSEHFIGSIPFTLGDVTVGSESELQAAVYGARDHVDLPATIKDSSYYSNIIRRAGAGDMSSDPISDLEKYLDGPDRRLWENSWVRLPARTLCRGARLILREDLLADKTRPDGAKRSDQATFWLIDHGEEYLRVPISYLLKLALADIIGCRERANPLIRAAGARVMKHFLNDNTSPETFSFHITTLTREMGMGMAAAKEKGIRFLLTQLLLMYANEKFELKENGQTAMIYFSPHPPVRQKQLNEAISDSFYRSLFMSPCLSGWNQGEEKHAYMCLCHRILSASQLNAVAKMRDAGIITRNLITLPTLSNISLANNGVHISMGSKKLTGIMSNRAPGFGPAEEKSIGDLVIKIVEHFLPLFVGTYSAAPYRIGFTDFHAEKILAFLPHQLDFTHLRMIWRRWKKKAHLRVFGQPLTPFGWKALDRIVGRVFNLKGDYLPDFRLIDYPVALLSTPNSPALDGGLGNQEKLKRDLSYLGVFDQNMALYMLCRQRDFQSIGFSGFEGRFYSLFSSLTEDMAPAANLQALIIALAFKLALQGVVRHEHIPDDPCHESERRQIFFGAAIGIPTFFVRAVSGNAFLTDIISRTWGARFSRRYPGYKRVHNGSFRMALISFLEDQGQDLIEMFGMRDTIADLKERLDRPQARSAQGKLTRGILDTCSAKRPLDVEANEFNLAAETYYRTVLKRSYMNEALNFLKEEMSGLEARAANGCQYCGHGLKDAIGHVSPLDYISRTGQAMVNDQLSLDNTIKWIDLILLSLHFASDSDQIEYIEKEEENNATTSVRRAGNW